MKLFATVKERIAGSRAFIKRNQRFVPIISFFAGFVWDNATINRIDEVSDNLMIVLYLTLLAGLIVLMQFSDQDRLIMPLLKKYSQWFPAGIQFLFGGLFSVYVLFYFKSASFTKTALFLLILILLFVANEFLEKKLNNTYLLFSLYFFVAFSFFVFFVPVITGIMNTGMFILSSLLGFSLPAGILYFLHKKDIFPTRKIFHRHIYVITAVLVILNIFYWLNMIPPVPLAMKDTGIYHYAAKSELTDNYILKFQRPAWYQFFKSDDQKFYYQENDTVFCFASVFAPAKLTKKIAHKWQYYSEETQAWLTTDRSSYKLTGGRDGGYRGYTFKRNIQPGEWRIDIITDDDLILGRVKFRVIAEEKVGREFKTIEK